MGKKSHKIGHSEETSNNTDEVSIDFSKVGEKIKRIGKGFAWMRKNIFTNTVNIWILVVLVMILSVYVRMGPASLPITDQWAESTVFSNIQNNIAAQVRAQRPDLPESSVSQIVQNELNNYYATNKPQIDAQVQLLSLQFKAELQNDNGLTHMLGIDEYLWYSYAKWYDKNGYYGTEIVDGEPRFMLRYGRLGQDYYFVFPSYPINLLHNILSIFDSERTIEQSAFYISVVLMALVCIPAFFLGRKISGNVGGFFAASIIAVSASIVGRTLVGAPESDGYTILFPLLITWLFFEALDSKTMLKSGILAGTMGLLSSFFLFFWGGWWYTFLLILGMSVVYILYYGFQRYKKDEKLIGKELYREILIPATFFVSMLLFVALIGLATGGQTGKALTQVISAPLNPFNYITGFKAAAEGNIIGQDYALWPNVLRTVAELNPASIQSVLASPGSLNLGNMTLPIFWIGLLGIILLFFRYNENPKYPFYGAFLLVWLISVVYAGTTGVRFMVFVGIVIAFGLAHLVHYVVGPALNSVAKSMEQNKKEILKWTFILLLFFALLWAPIKQAKAIGDGAVPIFDDAWYKSMEPIANSTNKAITTSWWDYGHFFQAVSEQSVTFDGGDQVKRIYWAGRTLVTDDEDEAIDILKMLNCGQEEGYNLLENYTKDRMHATKIMLEITRQERTEAMQTMLAAGLNQEQTDSVLKMTHCSDLYDMYFVTSQDMVGKATVWGYFGSWDFEKAYFYYHLKNLPLPDAITIAKDDLGYDANKTREMYNQAKKLANEDEAASWISTYPGYVTQQPVQCTKDASADVVVCNYNLLLNQQGGVNVVFSRGIINLTSQNNSIFVMQAIDQRTGSVVQQSSLIPTAINLDKNNKLERVVLQNSNFGYDVVLYEQSGTYYSLIAHEYLAQSLFTKLFFMNGEYTTHFEKVSDLTSFRGERIIVWKVNP